MMWKSRNFSNFISFWVFPGSSRILSTHRVLGSHRILGAYKVPKPPRVLGPHRVLVASWDFVVKKGPRSL